MEVQFYYWVGLKVQFLNNEKLKVQCCNRIR